MFEDFEEARAVWYGIRLGEELPNCPDYGSGRVELIESPESDYDFCCTAAVRSGDRETEALIA